MAAALAAHDAVLRGAIEAAGVMCSSTRAMACAQHSSPRLVPPQLRCRRSRSWSYGCAIGIHTGEAEERQGDLFGTTLSRCARILDAGHGGQILVSAVTRGLLDGVECVDLGEWVLKGFAQPERIFQSARTSSSHSAPRGD